VSFPVIEDVRAALRAVSGAGRENLGREKQSLYDMSSTPPEMLTHSLAPYLNINDDGSYAPRPCTIFGPRWRRNGIR